VDLAICGILPGPWDDGPARGTTVRDGPARGTTVRRRSGDGPARGTTVPFFCGPLVFKGAMYPWMSVAEVEAMLPTIAANDVSAVARSPRGFTSAYMAFRTPARMAKEWVPGERVTWAQKRELFIRRTLAQYKKKASHRRALALMAWAYAPDLTGIN